MLWVSTKNRKMQTKNEGCVLIKSIAHLLSRLCSLFRFVLFLADVIFSRRRHNLKMKFGTQARLLNEMAVNFQKSSATLTRRREYLMKRPPVFRDSIQKNFEEI